MNNFEELGQITRRAFVPHIIAQIQKPSALFEALVGDLIAAEEMRRAKLTRWQRLKEDVLAFVTPYWERVVLAWRVLRGDDIHEDCDP